MFYYSLPRLVDHPGQYFIGGDNIILVVEFSIFVKVIRDLDKRNKNSMFVLIFETNHICTFNKRASLKSIF